MPYYAGVRFKNAGKVYHFLVEDLQVVPNDKVIVETARGIECGEIVAEMKFFGDDEDVRATKKILRLATPEDIRREQENRKKEEDALHICQKKIDAHHLDMNLIDVAYTFDGSKILFYFTADGRVDFRELVKDLASVFRTRIELRQVGVRDEAKILGGFGICGNPFCCTAFLNDFQPVSIKMAKEQGLSMNPTKISGACGRLMCCLKYEQNVYEAFARITPRAGSVVQTPEGTGIVLDVNLLTGRLVIRLDKNREGVPKAFNRCEVKLVKEAVIEEPVPEELKSLE